VGGQTPLVQVPVAQSVDWTQGSVPPILQAPLMQISPILHGVAEVPQRQTPSVPQLGALAGQTPGKVELARQLMRPLPSLKQPVPEQAAHCHWPLLRLQEGWLMGQR
jgi:hypothetical protein